MRVAFMADTADQLAGRSLIRNVKARAALGVRCSPGGREVRDGVRVETKGRGEEEAEAVQTPVRQQPMAERSSEQLSGHASPDALASHEHEGARLRHADPFALARARLAG